MKENLMLSTLKVMCFILTVICIGTGIFIVNWDIPAPTKMIEKVINNDRFPK